MKPNSFMNRLAPFLGFGIMVSFFILAMIFFTYVFVIGAAIGLVLFCIGYIRHFFHKRRHPVEEINTTTEERIGNVYDHDEFR